MHKTKSAHLVPAVMPDLHTGLDPVLNYMPGSGSVFMPDLIRY